MKRNSHFLIAKICTICMILSILAGCRSQPETVEAPPPPLQQIDDVWSLLARGDGDRARPFFLGEVNVNATDRQGRTPLHYAAEHGDPVLARFFIAMGASVDARDNEQRTPLSISAEKKDAATASVLVEAGANIHFPMRDNTSPAHIAVQENAAFLSALLNPVSMSSTDSTGRTILHIAADAGRTEAVNTIIMAGSILSARDNRDETALDIALRRTDSKNHAEIAASLILAGENSNNPLFTYFAPAVRSANYNIRSSDGMAPLHYIARRGYMGYMSFMLEKNADVNIKNASGAAPLHEAARSGHLNIMEALLNYGADINTQDAKGNSVLHIAIPPENVLRATNLFLSRGINPNLRDEHGDSSLHVAIHLNRSEAVLRALLSGGADVTIRDIDGKTPLYIAIEKSRINLIPLLLAHRSDIFAVDNNGITPFEKALHDNNSMVSFLINDVTVFQNDSHGNTMLHLTVRAGENPQIINNILDRGASVNARNKTGDTALTIAARLNNEAAGLILLSHGADIFAANANGESPLFLTFPPQEGGPSGLRQWMLTPHTLSARDGLGNTALHYLAQWRFDSWIPALISMGANTEAANATGETPIFSAVKQNSPSTINVLVENGAILTARDTLGHSLLHASVRWDAIHSANTLLDLGLNINNHALNGKTPLHDSIRWWVHEMENLLLSRGADIEIRDAEGNTPFMEAVLAGNPATMENLARRGADINTRNFHGDTALHLTATMDRIDLSTQLLTWGVSIHARNAQDRTPLQNALVNSPRLIGIFLTADRLNSSDDYGSSPLHIAVQERVPVSIIGSIIEMGARLSSVDSEGRTPVRLAVDLNLPQTAKILADSGSDIFFAARDGRTAAEVALGRGEEIIRALFSGQAIHARDSSGNTILHFAARHSNRSIISLLLSLGAEKDVRNIAAESPVDIALRWRNHEAAALLN
jgi:hypothetical protein